jgi:hypothetical protein
MSWLHGWEQLWRCGSHLNVTSSKAVSAVSAPMAPHSSLSVGWSFTCARAGGARRGAVAGGLGAEPHRTTLSEADTRLAAARQTCRCLSTWGAPTSRTSEPHSQPHLQPAEAQRPQVRQRGRGAQQPWRQQDVVGVHLRADGVHTGVARRGARAE